jgi:hypothetical protein
MKQAANRAFCEGINRFLIHTSTATRPEDGKPGYEYGAGTHFNPNVTWWNQAGPFLQYISRCQYMLQQGLFVADILYYNGDGAPNIVAPKQVDPAVGPGYDYDVCNEEVLLTRLSVQHGKLVLPDGMSYHILVLPDTNKMPVPVLKKIVQLVKAGATVVGPKPEQDPGLRNYPQCDAEIKQLASTVQWESSLHEALKKKKLIPDFIHNSETAFIDFIHRATNDMDMYFIANRNNRDESLECSFRITGKQPELWNAVTGERKPITSFSTTGGYTTFTLPFVPFQSWFVIFTKAAKPVQQAPVFLSFTPKQQLTGSWTVHFDPAWGGPASVEFNELQDWTQRPEEGIKYYSGSAVYVKQFDVKDKAPGKRYFLDLGVVKNIAEVKLNGKKLGIVWTAPWRIEITQVLKSTNNTLEIEVVNCWPNRLIGDAALPKEKRLTHTNIEFKKETPLLPSGLLGPVTIQLAG